MRDALLQPYIISLQALYSPSPQNKGKGGEMMGKKERKKD